MRIFPAIVASTLLLPLVGIAQDFSGEVINIKDGDSVVVLTSQRRQIDVRLADIDAPERGQPYANRSRQLLAELAFRKTVNVVYNDADNYGRIVGRLYAGAIDISAEMVRQGAAWVYRDYVRDQSLFALEDQARTAKRGLWGLSEANIPPWEWRRNGNRTPSQTTQENVLPANFSCDVRKAVCREMTSCQEARFYLTQCGISSLDGDNDGIPCENICR
jgi:endonuclease YncB( thermonuclease family)